MSFITASKCDVCKRVTPIDHDTDAFNYDLPTGYIRVVGDTPNQYSFDYEGVEPHSRGRFVLDVCSVSCLYKGIEGLRYDSSETDVE